MYSGAEETERQQLIYYLLVLAFNEPEWLPAIRKANFQTLELQPLRDLIHNVKLAKHVRQTSTISENAIVMTASTIEELLYHNTSINIHHPISFTEVLTKDPDVVDNLRTVIAEHSHHVWMNSTNRLLMAVFGCLVGVKAENKYRNDLEKKEKKEKEKKNDQDAVIAALSLQIDAYHKEIEELKKKK